MGVWQVQLGENILISLIAGRSGMMVYNQSDSDGTDDDDLPPTQVVRSQGGPRKSRPSGNGKPSNSFQIDQQIRQLELDAYHSLLRAFSAQSEVITWSKEGLMSDMRKELRVADEQHREMLGKVSHDETLRRIRHWRQTGEDPGMPLHHQDTSPSPAVSQSRKRQKVGNVAPILPPPVPLLKPLPQTLPSGSGGRGLLSGKKSRSKGVADVIMPGRGAPGGTPGPASGRAGGVGSGRGAAPWSNHKGAGPSTDSRVEGWVGRRLRIRWPEDNIHYEAVVVDYSKESQLHCLAYDSGTPDESIEWVDLKGMDRNDVQWLDQRVDPVILDGKVGHLTPGERGGGRGTKRGRGAHGGVVGRPKGTGQRGRPAVTHDKVAPAPTPQSRPWRGGVGVEGDRNGTEEKGRRTHILYPEGEIAALEKSVGEMEYSKDVGKLENARQLAKDYEVALQKALAALSDYSIDDGSEDERVDVVDSPVPSVGLEKDPHHSIQDTGIRQEDSDEDDTGRDRGDEGSEGHHGGGGGEGGSDADLDNADDDGDGDDR
ncbi:hypothetical protein KC19_VG230700 [Ceratodon purpureus]|uniref:ENT domain-containing protein n=1 Tax=Ceratodon purpureus TaxID=3225 RepID=A0A8T0HSQ1_CERPU|nr:hypothetical protein KC19_VG230700 [Ceratodon purpureus]